MNTIFSDTKILPKINVSENEAAMEKAAQYL